MSSFKFGKLTWSSYLSKKNQIQGVNSSGCLWKDKIYTAIIDKFKYLVGMDIKGYIKELGENALYKIAYFSNHADMFYKFTELSREEFESHIANIKSEIEKIMKYGKLKEINKINMLNGWLIELEKLLDERLLYPLDQQCQEMYYLLLRHFNKFQSFDARSPEDLKALLQEIRESHRVAKSQLEAYSSGEADIRVKDSALATLRKVSDLLKSLKEALNKQLSKVRESANKLQKEFDRSYHKLLLHVEQSSIFADEEPKEFERKLGKIKERCLVASSQVEKYLSGADSSEERKHQAFEMLENSLTNIKEIEENLHVASNTRLHVNEIAIEIHKSYKRILQHTEKYQSFANQYSQQFKEHLNYIKDNYKCYCSYIDQYLSEKYNSKEKYIQSLKQIDKFLDEIKEIEQKLDGLLLKELNNAISQTYHKLLKHIDQSPRLTSLQRQNFIDDLKDIDRRREQATFTIETYLIETDGSEKKSEVFRVLEEIKRELDLSLVDEINAEIMHRRNRLEKYQQVIPAEESKQGSFKERLQRIENQCNDAHARLEPYFSGNNLSEEDKRVAFEILEECLEEAKVVEIDMTPFLKGPMIDKIGQSYAKLVQGENKSPIFTKQEMEDLNEHIDNAKKCIVDYKREQNNNDYKSLTDNFNKLNKLEKRISLYLRLQVLHNRHVKTFSRIEKHLNNTTKFDAEEKKNIRKSMEQNVLDANNKFGNVKKVLREDDSPMRIEYLGELSLNEYDRSIENLIKRASRLFGFDIGLHPPKAE